MDLPEGTKTYIRGDRDAELMIEVSPNEYVNETSFKKLFFVKDGKTIHRRSASELNKAA